MRYVENGPVSPKAIADLRAAVGWNRMEASYGNPRFTSYLHIEAYHQGQLIGYVDCISNGVTDAYIQDLMVHPAFQGKGIGTALMNRMIGSLKDRHIYMISVVFEENLKDFYRRFGFASMLSGQLQTYESD